MKRETCLRCKHCNLLIVLFVLFTGLLSTNVYAGEGKPDETPAAAQQDDFEFILELYGWVAKIDGTTATGTDFEIDFYTIVENLDFTLMSTPNLCSARNERFSLIRSGIVVRVKPA